MTSALPLSCPPRCCGACRFWQPTVCIAIAAQPHQQADAQARADESGLCMAFIEQHGEAYGWLRGEHGPFWGARPALADLTHADDGRECAAFEAMLR